jgi:putative ABC transport system permease protein
MLRKSPGFTAVAVMSLALGIGINTSLFSVTNAALWKSLPYKEADRLMMVYQTMANKSGATEKMQWSYPRFEALRDRSESFETLAAYCEREMTITDTDNPERVAVEIVSATYFPLLGIGADRGRVFLPEEDKAEGASPVALVSHDLWRGRFGSDENLIGQTVSINKVPLTVVGVMPRGFRGQSSKVDVWTHMMMAPQLFGIPKRLKQPGAFWHDVIGRLRPDVSPEQAQAEIDLSQRKIDETVPSFGMTLGANVVSLRDARIDPSMRTSLLVLLAAVGFVLLIACVNIANLLMSRGAARQKEIAIKLALGAGRGRLARQLLTESILLSVLGGLAGLIVALWSNELLVALKPAPAPGFWSRNFQSFDPNTVGLDGQVLAFNLLLSVFTGVLFGLVPALQSSRADLTGALKEGPARQAGGFRRLSARSFLVVAEVALALVLLAGAGLMIRSFVRLQSVETGFDSKNTLTFRADFQKATDYKELLDRLTAIPGVESASVATTAPLSSESAGSLMTIEGRADEKYGVSNHSIGPDYFKVLRVPLRRGRFFDEGDREGARRVAIINETAARRIWPDEDPLGKRINLSVGWQPENDLAEIIGIVGDVKYGRVEEAAGHDIYLSYLQPTEPSSVVFVRTASDPSRLVAAARKEVLSINKNSPLYDVKTMYERAAEATSKTRFNAMLLGLFAAIAMLLSAIGIYGVMSHAVAGRTQEIGIRMALGARPGDVMRLVMADALGLTMAGLVLGLAGAFAATRLLASQLYGVAATDSLTFVVVTGILGGVALLASYVPARRAMRVDPMVALRYE